MPYSRPSLTALQGLVAGDIAAQVGGDALLRFSNLGITGRVQAGLAHLHYGYLDWIAKQAVPFTCTDEFLEGWAALRGVYRKPAVSAAGWVTFSGAPGTVIPRGAAIVRSDGAAFSTTSAGTISADGTATVPAIAKADATGLTGAFGNTAVGTTMTLAQSIAGVQSKGIASTAFTGGQDIELDNSLRTRMLAAYQQAAAGGSPGDYETWTKQVAGVTRAWCAPNGFGPGTVVMYVMMDQVRAAYSGFPQGTNGAAALETRAAAATGDQLEIANYLYGLQGAIGLVYVVAPKPRPVNLTLAGIPASLQAQVTAAIQGYLQTQGVPGAAVPFGGLWSVIAAVAGSNVFTATPTTDILCGPGELAVIGDISYP